HHSGFLEKTSGGLRWHVRRSALRPALAQIMEDPEGCLAMSSRQLKRGRSSTVGECSGFVVKRYKPRTAAKCLKQALRRSRALHEFRCAYHLELLGIAAARP